MVIGRQVPTDFGGEIDLLCLDSTGSLVVVELKRGKTPRDVTAQALDYASWVKTLNYQQVESLAQEYLKGSLNEKFSENFGEELPETFDHRSLVVAEEMDASTERIIRYLSDMNVPINVATVQYFKDSDGRETLAQVYLVEPELAAVKAVSTSTKRPYLLLSEIQAIANDNGVGGLYRHLANKASGKLSMFANSKNLGFRPPHGSKNYRTLFDVNPSDSNDQLGLKFRLNGTRFANFYELGVEQVKDILPENHQSLPPEGWRGATEEEKANWAGYQGRFYTTDEIDKFLSALD